ncbi:MAG: glycosyl transferase [Ferruginibacter sp.]|nr:glycosyl transferase [Ferruginibacter sp.]
MTTNSSSFSKGDSTATFVLTGFLLLKICLQYFLVHPDFELHRDEFLHLDQARHLAWGYVSVPPFTSWIAYLIGLLGNSLFWVRFFPALFGAATIFFSWQIVKTCGGGLFAKSLTAVALLLSTLMRINILFQPNSFDILAWTALFYFIIRFVQEQHPKWIYFAAISFAVGFLNKYSLLFVAAALLPALLITSQRKVFRNKHIYLAALLALLLISPNIIWQINNHFPVVGHMKELAETQLANVSRAGFLKDQVLFFFPALFVIISAIFGFWKYAPLKPYRFVGWTVIFCLALFIFLRAKSYYAIGLYPALIPFGAIYLEYLFRRGWRRYLMPLSFALIILLFLPMRIMLPNISPEKMLAQQDRYRKFGMLTWEDGKEHPLSQDFADMRGWKELAAKTAAVLHNLPAAVADETIVICDNYGFAGAVNYYGGLHAVSFNADYINWFPLQKKLTNVILVKEAADDAHRQAPYFQSVQLMDSMTDPYAREKGAKIYLLQHAKIDLNAYLQKRIDEEKH